MDCATPLLVKIYADTADLVLISEMCNRYGHLVSGVTTNPSLARKAGVPDYRTFILEATALVGPRSISFEVLADDFAEMKRQALWIASQGANVYVKIPIINTRGEWCTELISALSQAGVKVNVTAIFDDGQVKAACEAVGDATPSILSLFCGRISDTGRDCLPLVERAVRQARGRPIEILWASAREPYNVVQAAGAKAQIITLFPEFIRKLRLLGKDLREFSRETVQMFVDDAQASGFVL